MHKGPTHGGLYLLDSNQHFLVIHNNLSTAAVPAAHATALTTALASSVPTISAVATSMASVPEPSAPITSAYPTITTSSSVLAAPAAQPPSSRPAAAAAVVDRGHHFLPGGGHPVRLQFHGA